MSIKGGILDSVRGVVPTKKETPWEEALRLTKEAAVRAETEKVAKRFHLEGAKTEDLDRLGALFGSERRPGEPDSIYRKRLSDVAKGRATDEEFIESIGVTERIPEEVKAEEDWFLDELDKI